MAATALVTYLRKMVLPLDLNPFYSYPGDVSFFVLKYFLPVLLAIGITAAAAAVARRRKIWPAVWGYYVLTLLPVLGLVQVGNQSMADRYTYLPSLGPFLVAGIALALLYEKMRKGEGRPVVRFFVPGLAALICASMIYLTATQTAVWKDSLTLWNYVIRMEPGKTFFPYNNRGIAYSDMGQYDRAIEDFNKVIAMNPDYPLVYNNRGIAFSRRGLYDNAIEDFSRAIALKPDFYDAYNNRGIAFDKAGLFEKAIEDFQKALVLNPGFERTYINRGVAYQHAGMLDRAIQDFNTALSINPRSENAYNNRGICFYKKGDFDRAIEDYTRAIAINPYSQEAYYNRGVSYYRKGLSDKAVQDMNMSASLAGRSGK
jgi:tetratricopeptide (TPR) repeat protein